MRGTTTALLALAGFVAGSAMIAVGGERRVGDVRRVVVVDNAPAVQRVAAEELATYCGRIAGTRIAIVPLSEYRPTDEGLSFFVGDEVARRLFNMELAPWQQEEWLLRTVPGGLLIAGDDATSGDPWSARVRAGSMLATYTLLDDYLGVRWFWPGPFGEHVPHDPDAIVPELNRREVPKFMIRWVMMAYTGYHTPEFREDCVRWMRRTRQGWTRSALFGHSWWYAFNLKTDDTFKEHPEWFALVNGKRQPPQMCTTHPEVINRMVEYVLNGKYDIMSISPSDGGGFCECNEETKSETHKRLGIPSCTSLDVPGVLAYDNKSPSLSDRIFTYTNEVARRVREKNPNKGVNIFAYTYYNKPPVRIKKLEPNLYISFVYQSAAHRDPENYREWKENVVGWQQLGAKMIVREGWGSHYHLDLPWVHYKLIARNLSEAYRMGFMAVYGDVSKAFATQAPNYWAITRMMWDPEQDSDRMMETFWREAYGPVASEMQMFFETYSDALDRNWARRRRIVDTSGVAYANLINSWHLILPLSVVDEAERHLRAAEAKVPPGEYADRVAFHRLGQDYTRLMLELLDCYRQLAELGVKIGWFSSAAETHREDDATKARLLHRAYELGEQREQMLLAHRDWAALNEGLYAYMEDKNKDEMLWHRAVKNALGIEKPTALTPDALKVK